MNIKEQIIEAVKELIELNRLEEEVKQKRIEAQNRITAIAIDDFRAWNEQDQPLVLGENNFINIDGVVYLLELVENLEFYRLAQSHATHF